MSARTLCFRAVPYAAYVRYLGQISLPWNLMHDLNSLIMLIGNIHQPLPDDPIRLWRSWAWSHVHHWSAVSLKTLFHTVTYRVCQTNCERVLKTRSAFNEVIGKSITALIF